MGQPSQFPLPPLSVMQKARYRVKEAGVTSDSRLEASNTFTTTLLRLTASVHRRAWQRSFCVF